MCGIVGYVGARPALGIVLDGLRRLEYRGYDSAGVAVVDGSALLTEKRAGKPAGPPSGTAAGPTSGTAAGPTSGTTAGPIAGPAANGSAVAATAAGLAMAPDVVPGARSAAVPAAAARLAEAMRRVCRRLDG